jgi:LysM repeat protein
MRKYLVGLFFVLAILNISFGQQGQLMIKGYGKDLHLDHKVSPKEGLFSIGRSYNVHPKAIAAYNKLDMAKGLTVGQLILIPLTDTNFSQAGNKGTPIYYTVGPKETLQKVSNLNNKVALENLREWNKLAKDDLAAGKKLIVGFLVTGENAVAAAQAAKKENKETTDNETSAEKKTEQDKPVTRNDPPKENKKTEQEKTVTRDEQAKENKKTEPLSVRPPVMATAQIAAQGYFKTDFDQQVRLTPISKTETVTAGIFKMNSRPREVKYYLLADRVVPGTIVRVINPDNNKAVYAKVLGEMSGIRQNQGLDIRISNTAAASLGISETDKFIVQINY